MALTAKQLKERVKVICYNKLERWTRQEAIDFYTEGMMASDGSEKERYASIVWQLMAGFRTCSDKL